jgi:hypothetical protein
MGDNLDSAQTHLGNLRVQADATLHSTPETVLWGYIAANLPPALTIKSGQIVEIEALSHQGLTTSQDPEKFFGAHGIPANEVLTDAKIVFSEMKRPKGARSTFSPDPFTSKQRNLEIRWKCACSISSSVCLTALTTRALERACCPHY